MSGFKKRHVSSDRVAAVEAVSARVPIVGDPRMSPTELGATDAAPIQIAQHANDYKVGGVYEVPLGLVKSNPETAITPLEPSAKLPFTAGSPPRKSRASFRSAI